MNSRVGDGVEKIFKKVNVDKLPFKISPEKLNELGVDIADDLKNVFNGINMCPALKWCLSTVKKAKVFTLIYEANELGLSIYKEEIAKKLPEYSYKTIATIIDEGIQNGCYIPLKPYESIDKKKNLDKKVKNIRPSSELVTSFYNWNIDRILRISKILKKYK
jgi:N12 class adenine-specific DNA methylase